jgi:N-acetylglucosamine-6-phosphate deacetylase
MAITFPATCWKTIVQAKGAARCILISDASAVAGLRPGRDKTPVGGDLELHTNGRLSPAGAEFLAGAAPSLKDGILRAVAESGISMAAGLSMATANLGRFVGNLGILRTGAGADPIQFTVHRDSNKLNIERIWIKGVEWSDAKDCAFTSQSFESPNFSKLDGPRPNSVFDSIISAD